jgi:hypothetical protein
MVGPGVISFDKLDKRLFPAGNNRRSDKAGGEVKMAINVRMKNTVMIMKYLLTSKRCGFPDSEVMLSSPPFRDW